MVTSSSGPKEAGNRAVVRDTWAPTKHLPGGAKHEPPSPRSRPRFGNRLVTSQAVREQHGNTTPGSRTSRRTRWCFRNPPPTCRRSCASAPRTRVPVIPFGTGTSLEGHVNAPHGGVSIDFRDMNRVLAVHAEDLDCVVEPGITRKALNEHLRDQGLFFPIDPGADASLGGMAATRCSGTNAVRYGTMKDNVLALKVVLANGELMTTARRAKKSSAGYDLTRLIVGSEGTLGVITELTLRLSGIPEAIAAGVCPFPSVEACCNAAILTIQSGIPVARIELLDALQVKACNAYSKLALPETPMLFVEFHGSEAGVAEQSQRFGEIARELGGGPFEWATRPEDRTQALAGAPRRLLGRPRAAAGRAGVRHRRLRADLAAGRMRGRDPARHRREPAHRADPRPCRRRQFPSHACWWTWRTPTKSPAPRPCTSGSSPARSPWTAPAPASTGWGRARWPISLPSTARRRSPPCARSSGRSTRTAS